MRDMYTVYLYGVHVLSHDDAVQFLVNNNQMTWDEAEECVNNA